MQTVTPLELKGKFCYMYKSPWAATVHGVVQAVALQTGAVQPPISCGGNYFFTPQKECLATAPVLLPEVTLLLKESVGLSRVVLDAYQRN